MHNRIRKAGAATPAFLSIREACSRSVTSFTRPIYPLSALATLLLLLIAPLAGCASLAPSADTRPPLTPGVLRIGYTPNSLLMAVMLKGELAARIEEKHDARIEWAEYADDASLFRAIQEGRADLGSVGAAVPAFLQRPDDPIVYLAAEPGNPAAYAIAVPLDSEIFQTSDLKGKKVAFPPHTNEHALLLQALEEAGLAMSDIRPYAPPGGEPPDLLNGNKADAWVLSEPLLSQAELQGIRLIADGTGKRGIRDIYIAPADRHAGREELYRSALLHIQLHTEWTMSDIHEAADLLTEHSDIEHAMWLSSFERKAYGAAPFLGSIAAEQQQLIDDLAARGERQGTVDVQAAVR